ncbi:hypothetical protein [Actinoplanes sp. NPDC049265]|uniref:oxidoreductase n=1 Tax=Actinoplanes sp. NPDC049265 TaxID=3363902 RepID=UPI0037200908
MTTAFDGYDLSGTKLANRIAMSPTTRSRAYGPGASPTPLMASYYAQRASAGLIITESTQSSAAGRSGLPAPAREPRPQPDKQHPHLQPTGRTTPSSTTGRRWRRPAGHGGLARPERHRPGATTAEGIRRTRGTSRIDGLLRHRDTPHRSAGNDRCSKESPPRRPPATQPRGPRPPSLRRRTRTPASRWTPEAPRPRWGCYSPAGGAVQPVERIQVGRSHTVGSIALTAARSAW